MPTEEQKLNRYRKVFEQCDTDQNNLICLKELKAFLRSKGHTEDLPDDQIQYIFKMAAKDGEKTLNFDQFVEILEHPDLQHLFQHYWTSYVKFLVPQHKPVAAKQVVPRGRSIRVTYHDEKDDVQLGTARLQRRSSITSVQIGLLGKDEQDITYMDEFSCCPPPFAMVLITILELAFFLTDELTEKNSTLQGSGVTAQIFIYDPAKRHEAWRFLTYMFVHIGYLHIVINLIFQLLLGLPLEMVHKWWRVSLLYFAGVIAGSLATSITDPWVRLAGASGGVYSLLTAHIATIIMNWSEMRFPFVQMFIFGIIIFFDLGSSIYDRYYLNVNDQVGYAAHFGGALAGLLVGIYLLKNLNVKNCEKYIWWGAMVTYVVLMLTAILLNIFLPGRYPPRQS